MQQDVKLEVSAEDPRPHETLYYKGDAGPSAEFKSMKLRAASESLSCL